MKDESRELEHNRGGIRFTYIVARFSGSTLYRGSFGCSRRVQPGGRTQDTGGGHEARLAPRTPRLATRTPRLLWRRF